MSHLCHCQARISAGTDLHSRVLLLDYRRHNGVPIAEKNIDKHTAEAVPVVLQRSGRARNGHKPGHYLRPAPRSEDKNLSATSTSTLLLREYRFLISFKPKISTLLAQSYQSAPSGTRPITAALTTASLPFTASRFLNIFVMLFLAVWLLIF